MRIKNSTLNPFDHPSWELPTGSIGLVSTPIPPDFWGISGIISAGSGFSGAAPGTGEVETPHGASGVREPQIAAIRAASGPCPPPRARSVTGAPRSGPRSVPRAGKNHLERDETGNAGRVREGRVRIQLELGLA